jgi:hypothetical protein
MLSSQNRRDESPVVVPFVPFRCPKCRRHRPDTYGKAGRVRYHQCTSCGTKYRSYELDAAQVSPAAVASMILPAAGPQGRDQNGALAANLAREVRA